MSNISFSLKWPNGPFDTSWMTFQMFCCLQMLIWMVNPSEMSQMFLNDWNKWRPTFSELGNHVFWQFMLKSVTFWSRLLLFFLQGFAAGLMLSISFLDLAHNAINSIGFLKGNLWVSCTVPGWKSVCYYVRKLFVFALII